MLVFKGGDDGAVHGVGVDFMGIGLGVVEGGAAAFNHGGLAEIKENVCEGVGMGEIVVCNRHINNHLNQFLLIRIYLF